MILLKKIETRHDKFQTCKLFAIFSVFLLKFCLAISEVIVKQFVTTVLNLKQPGDSYKSIKGVAWCESTLSSRLVSSNENQGVYMGGWKHLTFSFGASASLAGLRYLLSTLNMSLLMT